MNAERAIFRSSGQPGFTAYVSGNPQRIEARKREHTVQVRFTPVACTVETAEGSVQAKPGDAIITGIAGEHWRVSRTRFHEKYQPVPPTVEGEAGAYHSLRYRVLALRMDRPFEVLLADGISRLTGHVGDWLIDYGDGSLGIVSMPIFTKTYEILS
ncbi:MAG: PGDYG domain-containing protein [Steroidobacteraceae bacterium]